MTRNQLPEGVGKKIVEALKRQAEADIAPMEEESVSVANELPLTELEDLPDLDLGNSNINNSESQEIFEEEDVLQEKLQTLNNTSSLNDNPIINEPVLKVKEDVNPEISTINKNEGGAYFQNLPLNQDKKEGISLKDESYIKMPSNVATLRKLILGLPSGVSKQTGAQIIKQTFDAMGIPMNNVLKEAQVFQEELNGSTREYMIKIQEYKTQIMQLEKSVSDYQQSISQVNDLISLFLAAER